MNYSTIDLFSSQFYFNVKKSQIRKGTLAGSLLSIAVVTLTAYYFGFLLNLYINNLIEPNYKAQNFSNENFNELELTEDLLAFRFESSFNQSVEQLEKQTNSTFFVYKVNFIYINQAKFYSIPIHFVKCSIPSLEGFYCLNFSNLQNKVLVQASKNNIQSQIQINTYGCRDLDSIKTTIPDNCASEQDIDNAINALNAGIRIKIKTSQFNTTSQLLQTSYRSTLVYALSNQQVLTTLKIQKQMTSVKYGYLIQRQDHFSSPLQYNIENQTLDRQSAMQLVGIGSMSLIAVQVDDLFQEVEIEYPAIAQILALVNSIFSILMLSGFIGRKISWRSIKQDFFLFLLQNNYQDLYLELQKSIMPNKSIVNSKHDNKYQGNTNLSQEQKVRQLECINQQLEQQLDNESDLQLDLQKQEDGLQQIQKLQNLRRSISFKSKKDLDSQNSIQNKQVKKPVSKFFEEKNDSQKNKKIFQKRDNSDNTNCLVPPQKIKQKKVQQIHLEQSDTSKQSTLNLELGQNQSMSNEGSTQKKNSFVLQRTPFSSSEQVNLEKNSIEQNNQQQIQNLKMIKDNHIPTKIQNMILKKINSYKKNQSNKSLNLKQKIESQVEQELDIFKLYKDILFLKKAVSILLSQEQLASLEIVGCSSNFLEIDFNRVEDITAIKQSINLQKMLKQLIK